MLNWGDILKKHDALHQRCRRIELSFLAVAAASLALLLAIVCYSCFGHPHWR